jgi:sigma-B regulation protein RsbQ
MSVLDLHDVRVSGSGSRAIVFAHGFGCDQAMWRFVAPHFEDAFRVVTFDYIGMGGTDPRAYDPEKYASLDGFAADVIAIAEALDLRDAVLVGHSVSAMIGAIAVRHAPGRFGKLVMVAPSPCYIDERAPDGTLIYRGGFEADQIDELLAFLDENHMGWSEAMAPTIVGNPDRPELGEELTNSFCRTDPEIAKRFARATFLSDNRADLPNVRVPTLVLQCRDDLIAPDEVGVYTARHLPDATLVRLTATGHCPNLSAPEETTEAIRAFV